MAARWIRWTGIGLGGLLLALVIGAAIVYVVSNRRVTELVTVTPEAIVIPDDSASLVRGAHLVEAVVKCPLCHRPDFSGEPMSMGPVGTLVAPNLTRGLGGKGGLSDGEWVLAIRHAVAGDGRPLLFMPAEAYSYMTESDLASVIAYVKQAAPVDHELPATTLGPVGRLILTLSPEALLPSRRIDHQAPFPAPVAPGPTPEYGEYLVRIGVCLVCHGEDLRGGIKEGPPGTPPSADLTPEGPTGGWTEADFRTALRTGVRPDGTAINPFMPWAASGKMTDEEIAAVWAFLRK